MTSLELIAIYENVADITDQMLSAARNRNWDLLVKLEASCTVQVQTIKDNEIPVILERDVRDKKIGVIKKILDDDRKIRDLTEPWMQQLTQLMKYSEVQRKLTHAYQIDDHR